MNLFFFNSFKYLRLLLFQIKPQSVHVYKSVACKNSMQHCFVVFSETNSPHEETNFPHGFVVLFVPYCIGVIFSRKCEKWMVGKKVLKGHDCVERFSIEGGFKPSAHYA